MEGLLSAVAVLNLCISGVLLAPVNITDLDAQNYLVRFGYMEESEEGNGANLKPALLAYQRVAGIPMTGDIDEATLEMMNKPRCGMRDKSLVNTTGVARYNTATVWPKTSLTWSMINHSPDLSASAADSAIADAFSPWAAASKLSFSKTTGNGDIMIQFVSDGHEHEAFDGEGGVLAHAAFPTSGRACFDEAESWTSAYLQAVGLHEFGHSIGLDHSDTDGAVMYPYYQALSSLQDDDIAGVRSLYGE